MHDPIDLGQSLRPHIEGAFGKMARTFLKRIRVASWEELRERILQGIAEINAAPVVHRWRKFTIY